MSTGVWHTRSQLLAVLAAFWLYLVIGAFVFSAIERPHAIDIHREFAVAVAKFMSNNSCVSPDSLLEYSNALIDVYSDGLMWTEKYGFNTSEAEYQHWDIIDSLFFCATVVTTIGYGHLSPSSDLGRSICIVYALFGIPLSGLLVTLIGDQIKKHLDSLWNTLWARITCLPKAKSTLGRRLALVVVVLLAGVCFYLVLIIVPACIFYYLEGWDWLTSHYYSFISFTTIGFGDFVAGDSPMFTHAGRAAYKVLLIFYLVLGMGFVTKLLHGLQRRNARRVSRISKKRVIRRIRRRGRQRKAKDLTDGATTPTSSRSSQSGEEFVVFEMQSVVEAGGKGEHIDMQDEGSEIEYETITMLEVAVQTVQCVPAEVFNTIDQSQPACEYGKKCDKPNGCEKLPSVLKTIVTANAPPTWKITENSLFSDPYHRTRHKSM